jgi:hypothetical protein
MALMALNGFWDEMERLDREWPEAAKTNTDLVSFFENFLSTFPYRNCDH